MIKKDGGREGEKENDDSEAKTNLPKYSNVSLIKFWNEDF